MGIPKDLTPCSGLLPTFLQMMQHASVKILTLRLRRICMNDSCSLSR